MVIGRLDIVYDKFFLWLKEREVVVEPMDNGQGVTEFPICQSSMINIEVCKL